MERTWPARMEHVAEMCEFVHSGALETGMGAEGAGRLRLAVEEVASNIVRHGFAPGEADWASF